MANNTQKKLQTKDNTPKTSPSPQTTKRSGGALAEKPDKRERAQSHNKYLSHNIYYADKTRKKAFNFN